MWDNIFKPVDILQKGLSAAWTRNAVIRNNIANVETPGYKAYDVQFESLMAEALFREEEVAYTGKKTHPNHIDNVNGFVGAKTHEKHVDIGGKKQETRIDDVMSVRPKITHREGLSMRMDGNNVDIENENVKLVQNSRYDNTLMEKMNSELRRLRMAINEGK
jgi:flagellar basal-body rod protein FlgB